MRSGCIRLSACCVLGMMCLSLSAQEVVDDAGTQRGGQVGTWPSINSDGGSIAVSYYCERDYAPEAASYALRFAWRTPTGWQYHTISSGSGGAWSQLDRASSGQYHIVWYRFGMLSWATGSGTSWTISPARVDQGLVYPTNVSLVLDSADRPHVVYLESDPGQPANLYYTFWDGSSWLRGPSQLVASGIRTAASFGGDQLALDTNARPHVIFVDNPDYLLGPVHIRELIGSVWQDEQLPFEAYDTKLKLDELDNPHVAYNNHSGLFYATRQGGQWVSTLIDPDFANSLSLTLDANGDPVIGYRTGNDVRVATMASGSWQSDPVELGDDFRIMAPIGTDIVVDPSGSPLLAYGALTDLGGGQTSSDMHAGITNPLCLTIITQPLSVTACPDSIVSFEIFASGQGGVSYQWQATRDGSNWSNLIDGEYEFDDVSLEISGANTPSVSIQGFREDNGQGFDLIPLAVRCELISGCGNELSDPAQIMICEPDLRCDQSLDFFDISAFLSAFATSDPSADFTGDGVFDFFDVSAFLSAYNAGCP